MPLENYEKNPNARALPADNRDYKDGLDPFCYQFCGVSLAYLMNKNTL
jgi:hypothetical protein